MTIRRIIHDPDTRQSVPLGPAAAGYSIQASSRNLVAASESLDLDGRIVDGQLLIDLGGGSDGESYWIEASSGDLDGETREYQLEVAVINGRWVMPDGGAPMLSVAEFVSRFGFDEILRLTDGGDGRMDRGLIIAALSDAQSLAESFIATRYQLPLDPVPQLVQLIIADLALARLYRREPPAQVAANEKEARRLLERISRGEVRFPPNDNVADTAQTGDPVRFYEGQRAYSDNLDRYRRGRP